MSEGGASRIGTGSRAVFRPRDCHAHTTFSDGDLAPADAALAARARQVRPAISDHVSGDVARSVRDLAGVRRYLRALEALADADLAIGAEFCWHDPLWREIPLALLTRFTHTIGSLHAIVLPGGSQVHMFQQRLPEGLGREAYMDAHVAGFERLTSEMTVDIFAHPTLLPLPLREVPLEELWTEEREERAVRALASRGIAFEVSNRYRPHERFVRRAVQAGVRISLGSDGHAAEHVGDLAWPLEAARAAGVRDSDLYEPLTHGSRILRRAG